MNTPRILMAAAAVAFLSTAALAQAPSADQVSVPAGAGGKMHHGKMAALFNSPDEMMMFRLQLREATRGMAKEQKHAYKKSEMQKLKAMTGQQRVAYLQGLDAQWNALSPDQRAHIERHIENHQARRAEKQQGYAQQPQGYPQDGATQPMNTPR
jgi:hypothetical protein